MTLPVEINPLLLGSQDTGYKIERSLRFNSADSAYLSRTPASAGNRTTWTWSGWVKRSALGSRQDFFGIDNSNGIKFGDVTSDNFDFEIYNGTGASYYVRTSQQFRDPSAWYHIVCVWDSNNATASDRQRVYINGVRATAITTGNSIPSGATSAFNNNVAHNIGRNPQGGFYFSGYLADVHFIDGQALDPTSFGEFDTITGVWKPKAYTGSYGTNGFRLDFSDNSGTTSTTLGKDRAGSNNWTPNNFSVTAGAGNDSLVDTPTPYGTDTGAGGEVRGNYATLNPLTRPAGGGSAFSTNNGNLGCNVAYVGPDSTIAMSSGKWYWEVTPVSGTASNNPRIGIVPSNHGTYSGTSVGDPAGTYGYASTGQKGSSGTYATYGASYTDGDIIGVALDMDAGTIVFYKNGASQGTAYTGLTGEFLASVGTGSSGTMSLVFNFGARPFAYAAPAGFKALCVQNLPEPTIVDGSDHFKVVLHTGTGSQQSITGVGFAPDLRWAKSRSNAYSHLLHDNVRGETKYLQSNSTNTEGTLANMSLDADGFTVHADDNGESVVSWLWKAGGAGVSNTDGSISSTVSANPSAGISIVGYTSPNNTADQTVGHGLGVAPGLIIAKNRDSSFNWDIFHKSLGYNASLTFTTAATRSGAFGSTINSSIFTTKNTYTHNGTNRYIALCFAEVEGFSKFGSYQANGSSDGPFIHLGFKAKFWMSKRTDSTSGWLLVDGERNTANVVDKYVRPDLSNAEATATIMDFLSNGVKFRGTTHNDAGATFIYAAFAENPFKYSLAR